VTQQGATSRELYLPAGEWTDFWSGEKIAGGKRLMADAPVTKIPVYVKAGSIVPMGPVVEYAQEKSDKPIELRIYPGADADFTLYDDAGDGYGYEHGEYATVAIHWDDAKHAVSLGARKGSFPGIDKKQGFRVVVVKPGNGNGWDVAAKGEEISYEGMALTKAIAAR
jgi:alpha-D-xyloside xylohydrolase